ncbi:hypothetical protein DZC30_17930 [Comamonas testosteroni]|uniref:Uncharacterized protein n=1 Tax=Comamonas testosteroni TaxID=285 RepID=A0A373FCM2_COMTE|nr:hypothetical protein DZC30_17930 [Comamonas testosteroni]
MRCRWIPSNKGKFSPPLRRFAPSPRGDDAIAARRLLLGVSGLGHACAQACLHLRAWVGPDLTVALSIDARMPF